MYIKMVFNKYLDIKINYTDGERTYKELTSKCVDILCIELRHFIYLLFIIYIITYETKTADNRDTDTFDPKTHRNFFRTFSKKTLRYLQYFRIKYPLVRAVYFWYNFGLGEQIGDNFAQADTTTIQSDFLGTFHLRDCIITITWSQFQKYHS